MNIKQELKNFYGTTEYHRWSVLFPMGLTDGMKFLCDKADSFWLMDIVGSVQHKPKVKEFSGFLIWRIVKQEKGCTVEAFWDCEDGGSYNDEKLVYRQEVGYTDFPFDNLGDVFEFYQQGQVILLKGEH